MFNLKPSIVCIKRTEVCGRCNNALYMFNKVQFDNTNCCRLERWKASLVVSGFYGGIEMTWKNI